jgi:hypothetical protein
VWKFDRLQFRIENNVNAAFKRLSHTPNERRVCETRNIRYAKG